MTGTGWRVVNGVSQLLECEEREAALGDLLEAGESAWQGFWGLLGLAIRRQAGLWRSWRPWLAGFGIALPGSLLLMGFSLAVSRIFQRGPGLWAPLGYSLLLIGWSWTGGFVVGAVSRRTVWVSAALCASPSLFCLARFRQDLPRPCLLLFLLPAIWGVSRGLRVSSMRLGSAVLLALAVTALTIPTWSRSPWFMSPALSWPAWYMVATARRVRNAP